MGWFYFILFVTIGVALDFTYNPSDNNWIHLLLFCTLIILFRLLSVRTEIITVKSKGTKKRGIFKVKQNIIRTTDGRVLLNVGDDFLLKFYPKKLQLKIKVGKTYKMKTYKFWFSNEYNVLSAQEVKPSIRRKSRKK